MKKVRYEWFYDRQKCIEILAQNFAESEKENLKRELNSDELIDIGVDAVEWFEFNIECAYVGEHTPIFLERFDDE